MLKLNGYTVYKPPPWLDRTHGSLSRTAKLDEAGAQAILDAKGSDSAANVATKHRVSVSTVRDIWARRNWRHLKTKTQN